MIDRNYKTISPSLAKKRIAKLVKAERDAWSEYKETEKLNSEFLTEYSRTKWLGYRNSLDAMGIVQVDILED
jgi:Txe/YoeB family toxin of Txe-Axe toxin-antitoxin module